MGGRISFLSMDEIGKQEWVANEEYRRVVANQIPVALFRVEFDGETARIAGRVRRTTFTA